MSPMPLLEDTFVEKAATDPDFRNALSMSLYLRFLSEVRELVATAIRVSDLDQANAIHQLAQQIDATNAPYYANVIEKFLSDKNNEPTFFKIVVIADHLGRLVKLELVDATPSNVEQLAQGLL